MAIDTLAANPCCCGCMFLIVVDAHSRWLEIEKMDTTTSEKTIKKLQHLFARYGVPAQLVSGNGPQFKSEKFQLFLKRDGMESNTSHEHQTTMPAMV